MIAIIGGSGFYSLGKKAKDHKVSTKYGKAVLSEVSFQDERVIFLPRHGKSHTLPPHKINYRANIRALEKIGVTGVLAFYACGVMSKYKPGDIILVDDFIGFLTPATFYDNFTGGIKHVDFTKPFSSNMKDKLMEVASVNRLKLKKGGIMIATPGPRFETKSEVKLLKKLGANLVNMTCGYEMSLLGESEIDFAAIAIGSNYAAGISKKPLSTAENIKVMRSARGKINTLIAGFLEEVL